MEKIVQKNKPGRKPGKDNKIPLTIYIEQSIVTKIGGGLLFNGKDRARREAAAAVYKLAEYGNV